LEHTGTRILKIMLTNQTIDWQGEMLGRYRMIRLLGRGGMGEVWLAEDTELRRQIAAKLLPSVLASDESYLHAFEYEARTAAALEHPHILPIHDFGEQHIAADEVVTYLITPYMAGGSLRDLLRATTHVLPPHESLNYLKQAAQAIDYAHSQNVLHRDIKPANMLLQEGWLFLADFGLAKLLSSETQRTRTHTGSGTPEYMAPEQAQGHATSASDRYSLAMTAYQLLTGALPFRGDSPYEVLIKQIKTAPLAPTQWNPTLPLAVEELLLQGLAKRPEDRLPTCVAFVNALEQAFAPSQQAVFDDAEVTLPAPWNKRLHKIVLTSPLQQQQTPTFTTQDASLSQTPTQPSLSSQPSLQATPDRGREQTVMAPSHIGYPVPLTPIVEPQQNTYLPTLHYPPVQDSPTRQEETPLSQEPKRKIGRRELVIGGGTAAALAVAGGASFLIWQHTSSTPALPERAIPGPQKLIPGVPLLNITRHLRTVYNAVWDPTGRYLATAGEDQTVMLWDVGSYLAKSPKEVQTLTKPVRRWRLPGTIFSNALSWSYDGRYLVATPVTGANQIFLLDVFGKADDPIIYKDGSKTDDIGGPDFLYSAWSPTTSTFAAAVSNTQNVLLWQLKQPNTPIKTLYNDQGPRKVSGAAISVGNLAWSADGALLATMTNNFNLAIWDVKTGKVKYYINVPDAPLTLPPGTNAIFVLRDAMQWSPADNHLLLATNANIVNVWDVQQAKKPRWQLGTNDKDALTPPPNDDTGLGFKWNPNITGVSWSPNGRYLVGGYGRSHKIHIWDLQEKKPVVSKGIQMPSFLFGQYNGHGDTVTDTRWSPDGRYIATSSFDTTVIVWKVDEA
jgi:serine/threonine protein kinase/WD40 repeat protein